MMRCASGKRIYETIELAEEALIQNHIRNNYREGEGPINIYLCPNCSNYHFTSKGQTHPMFEDPDTVERIKKERIALDWERKLS